MSLFIVGVLGLWLAGVVLALALVAFSIDENDLPSDAEVRDWVADALIWFLVLLPWQEWLRLSRPGSHRLTS